MVHCLSALLDQAIVYTRSAIPLRTVSSAIAVHVTGVTVRARRLRRL